MIRKHKYLLLLLAIEVVFAFIIYQQWSLKGYYNGDALYDAQVALNLLNGEGYTTNQMPLYAINLYKEKGISLESPWINTHKFPLPVFIKLGLFKIFGVSLFTATFLYSALWHFLSLIALYYLSLYILKNQKLAFLSGIVFLSNPVLWYGNRFVMAGLNLTTDIFFLLLFCLFLIKFFNHQRKRDLFITGLISGLAFLNRYNSALYIVAALILLVFVLKGQKSWRELLDFKYGQTILKHYLNYLVGFVMVVAPWLIYNQVNFGFTFISINGLFQLLFDTKFGSFIDPWYKLEYIYSTAHPLIFALGQPLTMLIKWFQYASENVVRFLSFNGVWWWTFGLVGYFLLTKKNPKKDSQNNNLNWLLVLVAIISLWQLLLLPLWSGNIVYFFSLFALLSLPLAIFLDKVLVIVSNMAFEMKKPFTHLYSLFIRYKAENLFRSVIMIMIILALLFSLIGSTVSSFFVNLNIPLLAVLIAASLGTLVIILISFYNLSLGRVILVLLLLLYPLGKIGVSASIDNIAYLEERWDLESRPSIIKEFKNLSENGIVLSLAPWNLAWWSQAQVKSLPLPEYPDEIYLLEKEYQQNVEMIYLNKLNYYPKRLRPYQWTAFERMIEGGYAPENYKIIKQLPDGLILTRIEKDYDSSTKIIDVGEPSASGHLIWGFGLDNQESDISFAWINKFSPAPVEDEADNELEAGNIKPGRIPLKKMIDKMEIVEYINPDAEITFLVGAVKPAGVKLVVKSLVKNQVLDVILNGNLLARDSFGIDLGSAKLINTTEWQIVSFKLPSAGLRNGLNKLSFKLAQADSEQHMLAIDKIVFAFNE